MPVRSVAIFIFVLPIPKLELGPPLYLYKSGDKSSVVTLLLNKFTIIIYRNIIFFTPF